MHPKAQRRRKKRLKVDPKTGLRNRIKGSLKKALALPPTEEERQRYGILFEDPDDPLLLRAFGIDPESISGWNPTGIVTAGAAALSPGLVFFFGRTNQPVQILADLVGVSRETVVLMLDQMDLRKYLKAGRAMHKLGVSQAQRRAALMGDVQMLVWLGRNDLGQSADDHVVATRQAAEESLFAETEDEEGETTEDRVLGRVTVRESHVKKLKALRKKQALLERGGRAE